MYQAKIQLRPKSKKLHSFAVKEIMPKARIIKKKELKEGIDLYIDSNKVAFALAGKFKRQFHGTTKITRSLYGLNKEKGKRIHRLTVLLRLPEDL
jgi:NMD protein affecting ribosome stability and mRNA decay